MRDYVHVINFCSIIIIIIFSEIFLDHRYQWSRGNISNRGIIIITIITFLYIDD